MTGSKPGSGGIFLAGCELHVAFLCFLPAGDAALLRCFGGFGNAVCMEWMGLSLYAYGAIDMIPVEGPWMDY